MSQAPDLRILIRVARLLPVKHTPPRETHDPLERPGLQGVGEEEGERATGFEPATTGLEGRYSTS